MYLDTSELRGRVTCFTLQRRPPPDPFYMECARRKIARLWRRPAATPQDPLLQKLGGLEATMRCRTLDLRRLRWSTSCVTDKRWRLGFERLDWQPFLAEKLAECIGEFE